MVNRITGYLDPPAPSSNQLAARLGELQKALYASAQHIDEFNKSASAEENKAKADYYTDLAFFTGLLKGAVEKTGAKAKGQTFKFKYDIAPTATLKKYLIKKDMDLPLIEEVRSNFEDGIEQPALADQIAAFVSAFKDKYLFHPHTR